jgi:hypothetical protein
MGGWKFAKELNEKEKVLYNISKDQSLKIG